MRAYLGFVTLAAVLLGGCTTVDTRIARNQEVFDTFSPEAKRKIEAGEIARGFTKPMVQIAWGNPSDTVRREDENGASDVWIYRGYRSRHTTTFGIGGGFWGGGCRGRYGYVPYAYMPYDVTWREDYTRATVTFRSGRVVSYETNQR